MGIYYRYFMSNNPTELFNKKVYENFVLELMNLSEIVFPNTYSMIPNQSDGQCDFIDHDSGEEYEAKQPFQSEQIKLLTNGEKHSPKIGGVV